MVRSPAAIVRADKTCMSTIGSKLETALVQAAGASQQASRARDRERAKTESAQRTQDQVDLRIAGLESDQAVRKLPQNTSEHADSERKKPEIPPRRKDDAKKKPRIDLTA